MAKVCLWDVSRTGSYKIENLVNGKIYVGGAYKSFTKRWNAHKQALRRNAHPNRHLQRAWNKYGESSFKFSILEYAEPDKESVTACEQKWLDELKPYEKAIGYNICLQAHTQLGTKRDAEARTKMAAAKLGKKANLSDEERQKLSERMQGNKYAEGNPNAHHRQMTLKQIEAWQEKMKAYRKTVAPEKEAERRAKISAKLTGFKRPPMSEENRKKMKRVITDETKEKMRQAKLGKKQSPEHRAKIAAAKAAKKAEREMTSKKG